MKIELESGAVIANIPVIIAEKIVSLLFETVATPPIPLKQVKVRKTYTKRDSDDGEETRGKRPRLTDIEIENVVRCWKAGDVIKSICHKFNVSPATVSRLVKGMTREKEPITLD